MSPTALRIAAICLILGGLAAIGFGLPHVVTAALIVPGLIGFHSRQANQTGRLGMAGLGVMCLGAILFAGVEIAPWVGIALGTALEPVVFSVGLILALGGALLGWATNRGGVYPRSTGTGLIATTLSIFAIGAPFFGIYLAWLGYLVWSGKAASPSETPSAR